MKKWEYRVVYLEHLYKKHSITELNDLGKEGWEVVNFSLKTDSAFVLLKRPKEE